MVTAADAQATDPGAAFVARCQALADWAWARLVNRTDVWGQYLPLGRRGVEYTAADGGRRKTGNSVTRPPVPDRGRVTLTHQALARHFRGSLPEHVVGLHSTAWPGNTSLWGAVDIDQHGPADDARRAANWSAAAAWYDELTAAGFRPLLCDSNGDGGYHLWLLLNRPTPTADVFDFLQLLTADFAEYDLAARPETFPKQRGLVAKDDKVPCGNWLRVPGRHHSRPHWSRAWDGARWLDGAAAVERVLSLTGGPAEL